MYNMVQVPFHGDTLLAVKDEQGQVWVALKRMCEALGIEHARQVSKLKAKRWAVVHLMYTTGPDGKNYETFCLNLDSVPMWLATIDTNRVAPDVAPKLERYQEECAKALRDHFFGSGAPRNPRTGPVPPLLADMVREQQADEHNVMWPSDFAEQMCKLYRKPYAGGQPQWMSGVYRRLYDFVAGYETMQEIKLRNPDPKFGKNHHQWFTPRARDAMSRNVGVIMTLAQQSATAGEFWSRIAFKYAKQPFQLGLGAYPSKPRRASPKAAE